MIAKLQNPFAAAAVGLVLSLVVGVGLTWRPLSSMLTQAAEQASALRLSQQPEPIQKKGWDFWTIEIENLSNELKEERARMRPSSSLKR